jgi:ribosomal 30S subunit maturation factor RimM
VKSSQVFFEMCKVVAIFNLGASDVLMLKRERKIRMKVKQMIPIFKNVMY